MAAGRGQVAFRDLRSFTGKSGERVDMPAVALTKRELDPKKSWKAAPVADGSRQPRKRNNAAAQEPGEDVEAGRTKRKKTGDGCEPAAACEVLLRPPPQKMCSSR